MCDKKQFDTAREAKRFRKRSGKCNALQRAYFCESCHAYHLTTEEKWSSLDKGLEKRRREKRRPPSIDTDNWFSG